MKKPTWLAVSVLMVLAGWGVLLHGPGGPVAYAISPAEEYVLQQVKKGELADLKRQFGEAEKSRTLSTRFVAALLTGEFKDLKIDRHGVRIAHALIAEPLDLEFAVVSCPVELSNCQFLAPVTFKDCHFHKDLDLRGSHFHQDANCQFQAGINVFLQDVVFDGPARWAGASVGAELIASGARFNHDAFCPGLKVVRSAYFNNVIFQKQVNFFRAEIGEDLYLNKARLESCKIGALNFSGISIGWNAYLDGAYFLGPVNLQGSQIGRLFSAIGTRFENWVDFSEADIGKANIGAQAVSEEERGALLKGVKFKGSVLIFDAHFSNLTIEGSAARPVNISELKLVRTKVEGQTILAKVTIADQADFSDSRLQCLKIQNVIWPQQKDAVVLNGMEYQFIRAGEEGKDWPALIEWIGLSRFDTRNYKQLETYLQRSGYETEADKVYIMMKRRELENRGLVGRWATRIFWDWLAGYGRRPSHIFLASLVIFLTGTLVFKPEYAEGAQKIYKDTVCYNIMARLVLSLDQFLPAINLGVAKDWHYQEMPAIVALYACLHRLSGYVLISIALAALISSFK
ncbi:MAG: hypothetical protein PHW74_09180 [Desulfobacca sp.]|nr:hypothetical protein [Desulfobacca sp.]